MNHLWCKVGWCTLVVLTNLHLASAEEVQLPAVFSEFLSSGAYARVDGFEFHDFAIASETGDPLPVLCNIVVSGYSDGSRSGLLFTVPSGDFAVSSLGKLQHAAFQFSVLGGPDIIDSALLMEGSAAGRAYGIVATDIFTLDDPSETLGRNAVSVIGTGGGSNYGIAAFSAVQSVGIGVTIDTDSQEIDSNAEISGFRISVGTVPEPDIAVVGSAGTALVCLFRPRRLDSIKLQVR